MSWKRVFEVAKFAPRNEKELATALLKTRKRLPGILLYPPIMGDRAIEIGCECREVHISTKLEALFLPGVDRPTSLLRSRLNRSFQIELFQLLPLVSGRIVKVTMHPRTLTIRTHSRCPLRWRSSLNPR